MLKSTPFIWKNGELIKWEEATTHVLTHALHYGSAVFEGIRAYETDKGPAIFRGKDHYTRLKASADIYQMPSPYTGDQLLEATKELLAKNNLKSCYIRPLLYYGYGSMGVNPAKNPIDVIIAAWEWGAYLGQEALDVGIRTTISPWQKFSDKALPTKAKCAANYANSLLAKQDALTRGFDEALLLNQEGFVAEGSGENLFLIKNKSIFSPPSSDGALEGITADSIKTFIKDLGLPFEEKHVSKESLFEADELFFTGTAAEVTPICSIDNVTIGSGKKGPLTHQLQQQYFETITGKHAKYSDWLDFI